MKNNLVIVGGGISGLATAYYLGRLGIPSTLVEKQPRLGGLIRTDKIEGCELEAGPDSFVAAKPAVAGLASELDGLSSKIIGSNDRHRRIYMIRQGRLVALPAGMVMMVPSRWWPAFRSRLFSINSKIGLFRELAFRPQRRSADLSVSQFVEEHFGAAMAADVAAPLLSGVFGGDAARLSARSVLPRFLEYEEKFGSLIRGVRHDSRKKSRGGSLFLSFAGGMQTLTDALASAISSHTRIIQGEVRSVDPDGAGWQLQLSDSEVLPASHLVLTCPAFVSSQLLRSVSPDLSTELSAIPYSSAILITLIFRKTDISGQLDGFGFLVPPSERKTIAAATWIKTKFPSRIPDGLVAVRAFIVDPEATQIGAGDDESIVRSVLSDLRRVMGLSAAPAFHTLYRWPASMPQYLVGHGERYQRILHLLDQHPSLSLVSNAFEGVGIPDCVRLAQRAAQKIALLTSGPPTKP